MVPVRRSPLSTDPVLVALSEIGAIMTTLPCCFRPAGRLRGAAGCASDKPVLETNTAVARSAARKVFIRFPTSIGNGADCNDDIEFAWPARLAALPWRGLFLQRKSIGSFHARTARAPQRFHSRPDHADEEWRSGRAGLPAIGRLA